MNTIKKYFLEICASIITTLVLTTVNSACWVVYGQDEEPTSLERFKMYK